MCTHRSRRSTFCRPATGLESHAWPVRLAAAISGRHGPTLRELERHPAVSGQVDIHLAFRRAEALLDTDPDRSTRLERLGERLQLEAGELSLATCPAGGGLSLDPAQSAPGS